MSATEFDLVPPAIQWHEGMLLTPQHFQQLSQRQEMLAGYLSRSASPHPWGVRTLRIDPALLVNGTFRVDLVEAVMPDGLALRHPLPGGRHLELDLTKSADLFKAGPRRIQMVVAATGFETQDDGMRGRYTSFEARAVVDENTGDGEVRIPRIAPRVGLMIANDPPKRFVALPIAEVEYRNETFALTAYCPPCAKLDPSTPLGEELVFLAKRVREKAAFLADPARQRSGAGQAAVLETRFMVHGLVAALPALETLVYSGQAHPLDVTVALAHLAGGVGALTAGTLPPPPEPYDHLNIRAGMARLIAFIQKGLDGIQETYATIAFEETETGFRLRLPKGLDGGRLVVGARVRDGQGEDATARWMANCQIGGSHQVEDLFRDRILGAARRQVDHDPGLRLVPPRGTVLFAIEAEKGMVQPGGHIEIVNPAQRSAPARPAGLVLYARADASREGT